MMFLLTCDKKLTKSQLSPTHASTKRKITDELKHNAGWYEVREGSPERRSPTSNFWLKAFLHLTFPKDAGRDGKGKLGTPATTYEPTL